MLYQTVQIDPAAGCFLLERLAGYGTFCLRGSRRAAMTRSLPHRLQIRCNLDAGAHGGDQIESKMQKHQRRYSEGCKCAPNALFLVQ